MLPPTLVHAIRSSEARSRDVAGFQAEAASRLGFLQPFADVRFWPIASFDRYSGRAGTHARFRPRAEVGVMMKGGAYAVLRINQGNVGRVLQQ